MRRLQKRPPTLVLVMFEFDTRRVEAPKPRMKIWRRIAGAALTLFDALLQAIGMALAITVVALIPFVFLFTTVGVILLFMLSMSSSVASMSAALAWGYVYIVGAFTGFVFFGSILEGCYEAFLWLLGRPSKRETSWVGDKAEWVLVKALSPITFFLPAPTIRQYIPRSDRDYVMRRDGRRCRHCGSRRNLHIDHITPVSWGGTNALNNLQVLCQRCNLRKGNRYYG